MSLTNINMSLFALGSYMAARENIYSINDKRYAIADEMNRLVSLQANVNPESPMSVALQNQIKQIHTFDKSLEMQKCRLEVEENYCWNWHKSLESERKKDEDKRKRMIQNGVIFG